MTPHIESKLTDISPLVIMPGDPKRVEYIANNYLNDAYLVNSVRGELAYTGYYKGKRITIFSSGMGIPSMGIYSYELFKYYNVETIIRIGSAGSYKEDLLVKDIFLVTSSYSNSPYYKDLTSKNDTTLYASNDINKVVEETSKSLNINLKEGQVYSTETFYNDLLDIKEISSLCDCVEMESFSLLANAKYLNKKASCLLTISDSFITKEKLTSEEREKNFNDMITLALESIIKL